MPDPTRAAAVAALAEAKAGSRYPHHTTTAGAERQLDAILANPDHRRALLAVLLPVEELAAALSQLDEWATRPLDDAEVLLDVLTASADNPSVTSSLTEPTDTGSGS